MDANVTQLIQRQALSHLALQPMEWAIAGCLGSLMIVALVVLRIYLGWQYVGDRLLSASVAYEETGWCDAPLKCFLFKEQQTVIL